MKVIFFVRRYWPAVGGVERHVQFLTAALKEQSPSTEITIITEQYDSRLAKQEVFQGREIHRIPVSQSEKNRKNEVWDWLTAHSDVVKSADILHIHDVFFWMLPNLFSFPRPKIFITFHGYEPPGPPTWKQRVWHQLAELGTEANICVGGFHPKWYGVTPTITTFGATQSTVDAAQVSAASSSSSTKRYVFIGRLEEDTGIWSYLESFERIPDKDLELDVIGEGPLRQQLENFVKQNKLRVTFLGARFVSAQTYQKYTASLVSGYMTILESLAVGIPVISTYASSLKYDYLAATPFADWISIAAAGEELDLAISLPKQVSVNAKNWVAEQSWEKLVKQYLELWKK